MLLQCRDDFARYVIQCPDGCELRQQADTDFLIVPDPDDPQQPYWLFDDVLIFAATEGAFGLELLSLTPLN
jgi:hypothetical protein